MANGNTQQILSESDLARINTALEQLKRADDVISLAQQAGIDVAQFKDRATTTKDSLLRIKNTFFPGR